MSDTLGQLLEQYPSGAARLVWLGHHLGLSPQETVVIPAVFDGLVSSAHVAGKDRTVYTRESLYLECVRSPKLGAVVAHAVASAYREPATRHAADCTAAELWGGDGTAFPFSQKQAEAIMLAEGLPGGACEH